MNNFLRLDGPIVSGLYKVANMILLSLLWIVFCIPIFTIGASTSALYYSVQKNIKNSRSDSWSCFWKAFKKNFKQSTIVTLVLLAIVAVFMTDISIMNTLRETGYMNGYSRIFFAVVIGLIVLYGFWAMSYIARFEATTKEIFKNSLILAIMHFPTTIVIAAILAFCVFLVWMVHITVVILPTTGFLLISYPLENVFRKYMSDEDKRLEDELNMEWHGDYADDGSKIDYVEEQQKRQNRIRRNKGFNLQAQKEKDLETPKQSDYVRKQQEAMREKLNQQNKNGKKKRR